METLKEKTEKINAEILAERIATYNKKTGPRVGDFIMLDQGVITRFTHVLSDSIQAGGSAGAHSYYLGNGYISYSGSLSSGINKHDIIPTDKTLNGTVWFFSEDYAKAHNGVHFEVPFRVYKLREGAKVSDEYYYHLNPFTLYEIPQTRATHYKYQIQENGTNHAAFRTESALNNWLTITGLTKWKQYPNTNYWRLKGRVYENSEMCGPELFAQKYGHLQPVPVLSNGDYTIGHREEKSEGITIHYLNPNCKRPVCDRRVIEAMLDDGEDYSKYLAAVLYSFNNQ